MNQNIRTKIRESREKDTNAQIENLLAELRQEGYTVTFGTIGEKTTYAFLQNGEEEIVGYTFIKDLRYKNESVGKLKALQQAVTRKSLLNQEAQQNQ